MTASPLPPLSLYICPPDGIKVLAMSPTQAHMLAINPEGAVLARKEAFVTDFPVRCSMGWGGKEGRVEGRMVCFLLGVVA